MPNAPLGHNALVPRFTLQDHILAPKSHKLKSKVLTK